MTRRLSLRRLHRLCRRRRAQLALLVFAAVVIALGTLNGLGRIDALVADRLLGWSGHAAPQDVVVVGIDDASLAALGRWPWSRAVHARLLDVLTAAEPRAVGLDLMFSEPEPSSDATLAASMRRNGRVVLPLRMAPLQSGDAMVSLPVPALAAAAAGLGHLHVELDADGVARSIFLREGFGSVLWNHFSASLLAVAGEAGALPSADVQAGDDAPGWWRREQRYVLPYGGPAGHVRRLSYLDVLEGRVPATSLRGAIVLVGATAPGLMDAYPTPVSSQDALMPGVEITAQALIALREGRKLRAATPTEAALLTLGALALAAAALRFAPPWAAAAAMLALLPLTLCAAWVLLQGGVQWKPAAALLGLLLLYPLWSWQRLEAALAYLAREFERTRRQLPPDQRHDRPVARGDLLDRRMAALSGAAAHVRTLERQRQEALNFLSHDLRAPLSATLALIELRGSAQDTSPLPAIESHARRALALADGFVQLARAESAQGYRMELLDLRDPLVEGVDACWPQARARAIDLGSEAPEHECLAWADRSMLTRVMVNLIDNALKHAGAVDARVQCRLLAGEAGWRIEVADTGPPLQPDVAHGLFTRFRRGKADASGAGLGLAFVQAVAQRHGGRAGWRADVQGNVFFIELPAS
jgi:CHASE2 domain-containing sensor protein